MNLMETLVWCWNFFGYVSDMPLNFATLALKAGTCSMSDVSIDSRPNEFLSNLMFGDSAAGVCHSTHGVEDSFPHNSWDIRSYDAF